jgi:hypothetical protein
MENSTNLSQCWPQRMRRNIASEYLRHVHGVSLSAATLAKLAVLGGSPPFWKDGRFPVYGRDQLDEFAISRLGSLRTNTGSKHAA